MRIIAEKEGVPTVKVINQRSRTHAARREREKSQVLGTPINAMVVIIVGLQGQPAEGFALVQQPQGQDERKAKAGTMRQDVVEAHGMAQITLDLERRGPALRRGDKGDQETTKKRRRQSRRRRPGGSGSWGEGGIGVPACAWVHLYGGATRRAGESWLAPIWRSRQGFFFPTPRWSRCTYMGKPLSRVGEQYCVFQSCGEQFTNDAKKYFGDVSPICPFCQNCDDSRLHRFEECSFFQPVRREFPLLFNNWSSLPMQAKTYSLWPEPPMDDQFLCLLHNIPFLQVDRLEDDNLHIVFTFTDGSCKWQKYPDIRIGSFTAVEVLGNGSSAVIHSGLVPGQQSVHKGEILAGTVAVLRFHHVRIFTDNAAFLKTAEKILHCHLLQLPILLPEEERDLWSLFALALTAKSRKTKAHTELAKSSDAQVRFEGFYYDLAELSCQNCDCNLCRMFSKI